MEASPSRGDNERTLLGGRDLKGRTLNKEEGGQNKFLEKKKKKKKGVTTGR